MRDRRAVGGLALVPLHEWLTEYFSWIPLFAGPSSTSGRTMLTVGLVLAVMILPIISSIEHLKAGRLRALGVTTAARLEVVPEIPTVAEFLPGYEVSDWTGIGVPRGTPSP